MKSQNAAVLSYIRKHGSITHLEAYRELGVARLAARCHELRLAGVKLKARPLRVRTRGGWARVACYSL